VLFLFSQLRITIYSLVTGHTSYISSPITPPVRNTTPPTLLHAVRPRTLLPSPFTAPNAGDDDRRQSHYQPSRSHVGIEIGDAGSYFVVAERHKARDWLSVYDSSDQFNLIRVGGWLYLQSLVVGATTYGINFPAIRASQLLLPTLLV
jgi:hypothetical protein